MEVVIAVHLTAGEYPMKSCLNSDMYFSNLNDVHFDMSIEYRPVLDISSCIHVIYIQTHLFVTHCMKISCIGYNLATFVASHQ